MILLTLFNRSYKLGTLLLFICGSLLLSCFLKNSALAEEFLTLNTADKAPYSTDLNAGIYDKIILKMFEDIGVNIKINHLKSARSIENVDVGIDDGEYARIKGLSTRYKNIMIVDEKLIDFAFTAFAKDSSIKIHGWESLGKYNVAFIQGWKIYEMNVKNTESVLVVSSEEELFRVLEHDRVDIILYERLRGLDYLKRKQLPGIVHLDEPLSVRGMYLYVNKKHEKKIPHIENSLRVIKKSGQYQKIIDSFIH